MAIPSIGLRWTACSSAPRPLSHAYFTPCHKDSLGADGAEGRLRPHLLAVDKEMQLYRDNPRAVLGDRWTLLAKNEINSFQCIFVRGRGRTGLQFAMVNQFIALEAPDADRSQLAPNMKELCLEDLNVKEPNNVLKEFFIED